MAARHYRRDAHRIRGSQRRYPQDVELQAVKTEFDVLCIGDLDVDLFISVPSIPGFDQKISGRNLGQRPGGMSANTAVALTRLGRSVRLLSVVGDDAAGRETLAHLMADGVDVGFVKELPAVSTFMCVVLLSPSGEKSLIKLESDAYLPKPDDLVPEAFEGIRHVHATYGSADLTLRAFAMARDRNIPVSLDLEPPDIRLYPQHLSTVLSMVDTLFLNGEALKEASQALGRCIHPGMLRPGGEIVLTRGAEGCRRISDGGTLDVPGFKVEAVDTTGAGDCFAGAYLASKLENSPVHDRLQFANAAAAIATLSFGAQASMPRRDAVKQLLSTSGRFDASKTLSDGAR
ncbi:carbohydrate kinase family protein [Neorhizobium sp. P12A]|nr:carbohydrate kinase family protein [Neorhizobium sp. P12A]